MLCSPADPLLCLDLFRQVAVGHAEFEVFPFGGAVSRGAVAIERRELIPYGCREVSFELQHECRARTEAEKEVVHQCDAAWQTAVDRQVPSLNSYLFIDQLVERAVWRLDGTVGHILWLCTVSTSPA